MKALLFGCNGLLGQNIITSCPPGVTLTGSDLLAQAVHPDLKSYVPVDLSSSEAIKNLIKSEAPDVIINAAAFTVVDACEDKVDLAYRINAGVLTDMALAGIPLVHISTDFIFDGFAGPYTELSMPRPLSVYGASKLAAEPIALASHPQSLVLRTCLLWGKGQGGKLSFPEWVRGELAANRSIRCVTDQWGNPTLALHLAQVIWGLLNKNVGGLFHVSGNEYTSRYEWACAVANYYDLDTFLIQKALTSDLAQKAARPLKSGFLLDKLKKTLGWVPGDLNQQFADFQNPPTHNSKF